MEYYYREVSELVAHAFWDELSACLLSIRANPTLFHFDESGLRRCNLKRFKFHIMFIIQRDRVRIQVVRHNSRNPRYGTRRKTS